ncbi:MAG: hypothetical protein RBG13Loki_0006 [Promethearchaeota archaeon CR_4]|nr:MAG: hypothetical protein RBG13Loki_0006 [Candidatus Lokiarchaeota archaeon CR_4]
MMPEPFYYDRNDPDDHPREQPPIVTIDLGGTTKNLLFSSIHNFNDQVVDFR